MKSTLPNSSQFSPEQTPLPRLLQVVKAAEPSRQQIQDAIAAEFFAGRGAAADLANNTILAMSEYGLLDKPRADQTYAALTDLGNRLAAEVAESRVDEMYAQFATHILLNLHGLDLLDCARDLAASGQRPTKRLIVQELRRRGLYHPPNGTHANGMRQWLEEAGLVDAGMWTPNQRRLEALLGGISDEKLEALAQLTSQQKAFAKAFARLSVDEELSNRVANYATTLFGVEFPEGGLPQSTLFALRDAGLIECEKTTSGQGAKPYIVRPTPLLRSSLIEPVLDAIEQSVGGQYRELIRMPYQTILSGLDGTSTHEKGKALEALAFYFGRLLNLSFVQWRLRSRETGGAELDVVMEGTSLVFSRWQIQCKNSRQATLEDIAKEVGIAQVIKSNVILIVTTGRIGPAARSFAEKVMRETNLYVATLAGHDLRQLRDSPTEIVDILNEQAIGAMTLKREQVIL